MTTQPSRAKWWREVTDPDEVIQEGRFYRVESNDSASEYRCSHDKPRSDWHGGYRVFVDSRWNPPLNVGDEVTTPEQLDALPIKAVVKDTSDDVWQKFIGRYGGEDRWYGVGADRSMRSKELLRKFSPITIIYLPEGAEQ